MAVGRLSGQRGSSDGDSMVAAFGGGSLIACGRNNSDDNKNKGDGGGRWTLSTETLTTFFVKLNNYFLI